MSDKTYIFAGMASRTLVDDICSHLAVSPGKCVTKRFSDGETWVKIDENVRGATCFVVQSTYTPVNDHLMELLMFIDALKRASAESVTAVIPYFGYARQDRKDQGRVALSAKLVANLLTIAGATRVLTMDLHSAQIQGFFDIPLDHMSAQPVFVDYILKRHLPKMVVVSPDVGNVKRARNYAQALDVPLVIIEKRRPQANEAEVMNIFGNVQGCNVFMFDDMIDTAGTICNAAAALRESGAKDVYVACTHPVFSGPAIERLSKAGFRKIYVSDTIPQSKTDGLDNLEVISVAPILGEAIQRIHSNLSVSALFGSSS